MSKISLTNLVNLQNQTTAVNAINANNSVLTTAFDNTLSRDGTTPNTMGANLDMNSNQIINLPAPATTNSPLRLQDLNTFIGGGTVTNIPAGGTTGQVLAKTSNTDFAVNWTSESAELTAGTNIALTGTTPTTISTTNNPTFSTSVTTPSLILNGTTLNVSTGSGGSVVQATSPVLVTPTLGAATATTINKVTVTQPATSATLTIPDTVVMTGPAASGTVMTLGNNETVTGVKTFGAAGNVGKLVVAGTTSGSTVVNATAVASGVLALPAATDTLTGKATTDTLTNKTIDTAGTGNHIQISGVDITRGQILGESTTGSASAGNIGEYIESIIVTGSATSLTTGTAKTITSITLTAGDWDVSGIISYNTASTTSVTGTIGSLSATTNTNDLTAGKYVTNFWGAVVPGATSPAFSTVMPPYRMSVSGSTQVFLVATGFFTVSTLTGWGIIRARRIR